MTKEVSITDNVLDERIKQIDALIEALKHIREYSLDPWAVSTADDAIAKAEGK